ncbi:fungal specific transcription factor domain-containing protein [Trichoderma breve]|uniref:Fungal specific transcription factor domain-containing protein n=1 Tax=Trichoderma breve TaxID=2034170 RepID=A0A9W9BIV6_9HYPO|nr:fungal specific transcription factor domain-containing protein [Trichoderma breve]KAJ4861165.1 fungal specific transcription factor domain-containing protein [Trichoderma breve]
MRLRDNDRDVMLREAVKVASPAVLAGSAVISNIPGDKSLKNQNKATAIHSNSEALSTQTNNVNVGSATDAYLTASIITNGNGSIPRSLAAETMFARQLSPTEASRERYLLTYYIHTFIPQVTLVQSPSNFFTSLYIPMAFHYSGVMDAIIASSAAHLAKSVHGSDKIKELNSVAIRRQQLAREFVTEHTTCPKSSGHFLYHDVMSLIMEDVLDPETQADLSKRSGPFSDCAATLSVPRTQDLSGQEVVTKSISPSEFHQYGSAPQGVDCLLGLSKDLFSTITQLRRLPSRDSELIDMEAPAFLKIETDLTNWQYDHAIASALDFNTRLDLIALSECHRLTALILLYRRYPSRSYCLPHLASQVIGVLSRITPSSAVISALTPVLFLAGAELNSEVEMALCAARLKSIREANKMMNIAAVEEILRVIWEERLQKKGRADWLEILRTRRWTLSLG